MTPEREVELFAKLDLLLELYRRNADDISALRQEMAAARAETRADISEMRSEMAASRAEARSEMDAFRAETRSDMEAFRAETRSEMDAFRAEMRMELREVKTEVRELRTAQQEANSRLSRVEGRIEEQSKFLQLVLASRQPRKAAG